MCGRSPIMWTNFGLCCTVDLDEAKKRREEQSITLRTQKRDALLNKRRNQGAEQRPSIVLKANVID